MSILATSAQVIVALRKRYPTPEWAFLEEVRNGTGYMRTQQRTADALAMGCYPSRGLELNGFEIKVSRGDWLRELKDPDKSISIQEFCDRWWLVVGDENIVQPGELPAAWGLLAPRGKTLAVKVEAPKLDAKPVDRLLLASIMRNAVEGVVPKASVDVLAEAKAKEQIEELQQRLERELGWKDKERENVEERIKRFEEASGVDINDWQSARVGEAVRAVLASNNLLRSLKHAHAQMQDVCNAIKEHVASVEQELSFKEGDQ